MIIKIESLR